VSYTPESLFIISNCAAFVNGFWREK